MVLRRPDPGRVALAGRAAKEQSRGQSDSNYFPFLTATNDAYLFGARIAKAAPHRCTAKQGRLDQGDSYNFTIFGATSPNNGHFDESGFVEDNQGPDGVYPPALDVDKSNLPTVAEMSGASVSFQSTTDPDFI